MSKILISLSIVVADDDEDECEMLKEALEEYFTFSNLNFVRDGEELIDFLYYRGKYENAAHPPAQLIILDINMPKKDGKEVLPELRRNPKFSKIPIIGLTSTNVQEEITTLYCLGINSCIIKPMPYKEYKEVAKSIGLFWFRTAQLPIN